MNINNNYLLLFKINIQDSQPFKGWTDFIAKANEEANKHRPKSTIAPPAQKARYQALLDKIKELEAKADSGADFADFMQLQQREMLDLQAQKKEEIKRTLRFCDAEKLKSPDFVKTLCAEYAQFQITEDDILSLVKSVMTENESGGGDFSDYLTREDAKALEAALASAGRENSSLYEVLDERESSSVWDIQKQAHKSYENARKNNDGVLSALFGQCLKIFKTAESKQKYDNYLKISKYKKINHNIEEPIRLTGVTSIAENIASKIITQAVKDYPELSRAQAATYIKNHCEYWGYEVTIAATEFIQVAPLSIPEAKENDTVDKLIKTAEILLKQPDLCEKAKISFEEVTRVAPDNYHGWLGIARAITADFTLFEAVARNNAFEYVKCAMNVAGANRKEVEAKWSKYLRDYDIYKANLIRELNSLHQAIADVNTQIEQQTRERQARKLKLEKLENKTKYSKIKIFSTLLLTSSCIVIFLLARLFHTATLDDIAQLGYSSDIYLEIAIVTGLYLFAVFMLFFPTVRALFKQKRAKKALNKYNEELEMYNAIINGIDNNIAKSKGMDERFNSLKNMLEKC